MQIPIKKLYHHSRFPAGYNLFFLLLYTPLGIVLMIIRLFICVQLFFAATLLPQNKTITKFVLRVLYSVLGLVVCEENKHMKNVKSRLIITNHVTPFDHIAVSIVSPCVSASVYNLPGPISSLLCYKDLGVSKGRDYLRSNARSYINSNATSLLLLHPEGATTNGQIALMKYGSWAFDITKNILVVALSVNRLPIFPKISVLGASWISDLLYFLFSPFTVYKVMYIGKVEQNEDEDCNAFASRVQMVTAKKLELNVTNYSVRDKLEYVKRLAREEANVSNTLLSPDIKALAMQVCEVLPNASLEEIERDLAKTRSMHQTISNLLERNINQPSPQSSSREKTPSPTDSNTSSASTDFGVHASKRMESFQERKRSLINYARKKYIEKHNLKIPGVNC